MKQGTIIKLIEMLLNGSEPEPNPRIFSSADDA